MSGPIFDAEAERAVLGCLMAGVAPEPAQVLSGADFHVPANQAVFEAILSLVSTRQPLDHLVIAEQLRAAGQLEQVGGPAYLFKLDQSAPLSGNLPVYVATVRDRAVRRAIVAAAREALIGAEDLTRPSPNTALAASASLATLGAAGAVELETAEPAFGELLDDMQAIANGTKDAAIKTGIDVWDELIGGLPMGDLTLLGGYPSVGKSALMYRMMINLASAGVKVGCFSLEDPRVKFVRRAVARESGVPVHRIARERLSEFDMDRVGGAVERSYPWARNVVLTDRSGMRSSQIAAMARQMVAQRGCKAIFIDHAGEMKLDPSDDRHDLRLEQAILQIRDVAKDLKVAVVMLAHFHRPKGQTDKEPRFMRPNSAAWKNSGGFEQAARVAVGLWLSEKHPGGLVGTCLKQSEGTKDFDFWMPFHAPSGLIESVGGRRSDDTQGYSQEGQ